MIDAVSLRTGTKIIFEDEIYVVTGHQHQIMGRGRGQVQARLKQIQTGRVIDKVFRSEQKFEVPALSTKEAQFLYHDDLFHFMDTETFEQFAMNEEQIGDDVQFIKENMNVEILFHNGNPLLLQLPIFVELAVSETDPGLKGDTVSGSTKPATLETGNVIQVPLFIEVGDVLKVDTRTNEYVERV